MVPIEVKEGAISLGATEFETLKSVTLPFSFNGILLVFFSLLVELLAKLWQ